MSDSRTVLVTGAGGFIGGRLCEVLHDLGGFEVRPGVRRWSTAARIGRRPLDPIWCDVLDRESLDHAVEGVDLVVHCATGSPEVNVTGTQNVLDAARDAGVSRVVHLSTIDVYGRPQGEVSEEDPLVKTGRPYGDAKIEAESRCMGAVEAGLPVVVLRPTIVYGPFSKLWVLEFADRFSSGSWPIPLEKCTGRCNLVYVDDVVRAILLAFDQDDAVGHPMNINGPDSLTWAEYFEALNNAMGLGPLEPASILTSRVRTWAMTPVRRLGRFALDRFEGPVMALYQRSKMAKSLMKGVEGAIRGSATPQEFDLYAWDPHFKTDRALARLGYEPHTTVEEGVRRSVEWLRHIGRLDRRQDEG